MDDGEVVADQHVRDAEFRLQVLHQVEHLRLHGHIQRADRFVRDDQARARDQGPGDRDALALAAREFVRVLAQVVVAQPHRGDGVGRPLAALLARGVALRGQRLGDDALDGLARVERTVRVLEHHLDVAARLAQFLARQLMQVAPQQLDTARGRRIQRHHQAREGGLARTRFTDDAQAAAGLDREAHAVERMHLGRRLEQLLARHLVLPHQVVDLQQRGGHAAAPSRWAAATASSRMQRA